MTDTVLGAIIGVGGTIFGVILAGPLTYHFSKVLVKKTHENALDVMRRQEFHSAASKFRANIIYELSDLYPIEQYWDKKDFPRLYQSIPRINSTAAEFRHLVTRKADFDTAVNEYNKYCREIKEHDIFTIDFTSMKKPGDIKPKDRFKNIVEHLLSFADADEN